MTNIIAKLILFKYIDTPVIYSKNHSSEKNNLRKISTHASIRAETTQANNNEYPFIANFADNPKFISVFKNNPLRSSNNTFTTVLIKSTIIKVENKIYLFMFIKNEV